MSNQNESYLHDTRGSFGGNFEMEIYTPNKKDYPLFFQGNFLDNIKSGRMLLEFKDKDGKTHKLEGKILVTSGCQEQMGRYNERTFFGIRFDGAGELKQ